MDLAAILFLIALLLAVSLYLVSPLLSDRSRRAPEDTSDVSSLLAERERLLNALQELDFDHQLGKVPEEDYPDQRAELLQKGADVLKQLDTLIPSRSTPLVHEGSLDAAAAGQIETRSDDEIESMLAARRKARRTKSAGFCPRCGKPVLATDQFCPNCGKALQ